MSKSSRVPPAVGSLPVVGDLVKQAETQAQWMQELLEQNARLVAALPATMKSFNDSLERFNDTVSRLDQMVSRVERLVDVPSVRALPALADTLRKEALPALRAATDTQKQITVLQSTVERVVALVSELPGMGMLRRLSGEKPSA